MYAFYFLSQLPLNLLITIRTDARYNDLATFLGKYVPDAVGTNFTAELFNGGLLTQNSSSDSVEANLDIQYTIGLSHPIPNIYYSTGLVTFIVKQRGAC